MLIDKVWSPTNSVKVVFKNDGYFTHEGENFYVWSWQNGDKLIMKLTAFNDKNNHAYFKFSKLKEKSMTMQFSLTGPTNYKWQNPDNFTTK